ncbi:MAG: hypothetical protein KDJ75_02195 [Alphaproteobacteria bacterium]|nr:hypothetical protein [Alphaproteobacteria bacterium]
MSDTTGQIFTIGKKGNKAERVCRVAYTLNNEQPVTCTIIDSQPLFYLDFEDDFEEEGLFEDTEFENIEDELGFLRNEVELLDRWSGDMGHTQAELIAGFMDNKDMCAPRAAHAADAFTIEILQEQLGTSRLAAAYMESARQHSVTIRHSAQVAEALYERKSGIIQINPALEPAEQLLLAARELRRHWQHRQGALIHPLLFHPDNAILVNRAQIADLVVSMVRVAWELQLSGYKECWERIENSSMNDLGRAFAREAFLDFRTLNNGQAAASVFECWFLSDRCRQEDKRLIQQMLSDYQGYVFSMEECTAQQITPSLISALGSMPYGKNYLAQHAGVIMEDAVFTDVRDRSNANFLWFIKFEHSFRKTEQELQTDSDLSTGAVRHPVQHEDRSLSHDGTQTADIITLFSSNGRETGNEEKKSGKNFKLRRPSKRAGKSSADDAAGGNVIYFRQGFRE